MNLTLPGGLLLLGLLSTGGWVHADHPLLTSLGRYTGVGWSHAGYHSRANGQLRVVRNSHPASQYPRGIALTNIYQPSYQGGAGYTVSRDVQYYDGSMSSMQPGTLQSAEPKVAPSIAAPERLPEEPAAIEELPAPAHMPKSPSLDGMSEASPSDRVMAPLDPRDSSPGTPPAPGTPAPFGPGPTLAKPMADDLLDDREPSNGNELLQGDDLNMDDLLDGDDDDLLLYDRSLQPSLRVPVKQAQKTRPIRVPMPRRAYLPGQVILR